MRATHRFIRPVAAFLAVLMLSSGMLPLIQHACAMAATHARSTQAHPWPQDAQRMHHGMHPGMHGQEPMPAPVQAAPPCNREASGQPSNACCIVEATPQGVMPNNVRPAIRSAASTMGVVAAVLFETAPKSPDRFLRGLFLDVGPPPTAAVTLQLLHVLLLN